VMRTGPRMVLLNGESTIAHALAAMHKPPRNGACVIADERGKLRGIFTHGDFARIVLQNPHIIQESIAGHMTSPCKSIQNGALVFDALEIMHEKHINALPVVDHDMQVLGLLDIQDLV